MWNLEWGDGCRKAFQAEGTANAKTLKLKHVGCHQGKCNFHRIRVSEMWTTQAPSDFHTLTSQKVIIQQNK